MHVEIPTYYVHLYVCMHVCTCILTGSKPEKTHLVSNRRGLFPYLLSCCLSECYIRSRFMTSTCTNRHVCCIPMSCDQPVGADVGQIELWTESPDEVLLLGHLNSLLSVTCQLEFGDERAITWMKKPIWHGDVSVSLKCMSTFNLCVLSMK